MADDDRTRRRLGDATKGRIADLASGWTVDPAPVPDPAPDLDPGAAQRGKPAPPPRVTARGERMDDSAEIDAALDAAFASSDDAAPARSAPRTRPPNAPPGARTAPPTAPPGRTKPPTPPAQLSNNLPATSGTIGHTGPFDLVGPTGAKVRSAQPGTSGPVTDNAAAADGAPTPMELITRSGPASTRSTQAPARAPARAQAREHTQDPEGQESIFGPLLAKSRAKAGDAIRDEDARGIGSRSGPTNAIADEAARGIGSGSGPTNAIGAEGARGVGSKTGPTRAIGSQTGANRSIPPPPGQANGPGATDRSQARAVNAASGTISTEPGAAEPRRAPRTVPPPPPGKKVGSTSGPVAAIVPAGAASSGSALDRLPLRADVTDVSARPSAVPPPIPVARPLPRIDFVMPDESETFVEDGPPGAMPRLAVPVGEFDHGSVAGTEIEVDKRRVAFEQSTMKRDAANAILGLPEPALTTVKATPVEVLLGETAEHLRGDPTLESPATSRFERADPTQGDRGDNTKTQASAGAGAPSGTLRTSATLRRKRGLGGDLKYVATAVAGVRRARRELALLESRQALRTQSRERHLVTLGRAAVTLEGFDHPALGPAREQLGEVEEERSQHAGQVAAADSELLRVRRDREARAKQHAEDITALDAELVDATKKLEPLEKEQVRVTRRTTEMRDAIRRIDSQLAATEASLSSIKGAKQDKAAIQAELATLRADRQAIMRDEPKIATELDALSPRIASLEARRSDARKRRIELEQAEQQDQRRAEELLAAIGAKRKVVDRAAGDAETLRDKILFELGDRLYVDRPIDLGPQLAPIDVIDMELGTGDRRAMELREILSSIDKAKLARGIAVLIVLLAIIGAIGWLVLSVAL